MQVKRKGVRKTATFNTKTQARAWASKIETEIDAGIAGTMGELRTFSDAIDRYVDEVSSKKKGGALGMDPLKGNSRLLPQ